MPTKPPTKKRNRKSASGVDVMDILRGVRLSWATQLAKATEEPEGFVILSGKKLPVRKTESKDEEAQYVSALRLLKGILFKPDHPYRTKIGFYGNLSTSAAGVLNGTTNCSSITSAAEWSSIDALFDEFFIHSMTYIFQPFNHGGGGYTGSVGTAGGTITQATGTAACNACGVVVAALFNGAGTYGTAGAMLCNATHVRRMSNEAWDYVWRNNVKFDPRGPALSSATTEAWQGWTLITGATNYGGTIQVRTANDQALGDLTHAYLLGTVGVLYDVSFRARA